MAVKKTLYIQERVSKRTKRSTFYVRIPYKDGTEYIKLFAEKDYGSRQEAYEAALYNRDHHMKKVKQQETAKKQANFTVFEMFNRSNVLIMRTKGTIKKANKRFNTYIRNEYGTQNFREIKRSDIINCLNAAVKAGASQATLSEVYTIWKKIFQAAIIDELIDASPADYIEIPKSRKPRAKRDVTTSYATLEQVIQALRKHSSHQPRHMYDTEVIIKSLLVGYGTGLRPGEVLALSRNDIDFEKHIINLWREVGSDEENLVTLRDTKTELSKRIVPMNELVETVLKDLCDEVVTDLLFLDHKGDLFNTNNVSNKIGRVCKDEGIKFVRYDMRHQFTIDLLDMGTDTKTVMELMGHNNLAMTFSYDRSRIKDKEEAIKNRILT